MTIATLDQVISGLQPSDDFIKNNTSATVASRWVSFAYIAGRPAPSVAPTPGMAGAALTSYAGQFIFPNGAAKQYLARINGTPTVDVGSLILYDRLWHNSGIDVTSTSAQTINSVAWPARDRNASTDGVGVYVGLEVSTLTGAGASVISIDYTNQAGTAGRTGTARIAYTAASVAGTFYDFCLYAGDTGVRSIQNYTSTVSMTSGTVHLVAYKEITRLSLASVINIEFSQDAITMGLPEVFDDTVPFLIWVPRSTGTTGILSGQITWAHG